ncbi:hypothetical protein BGV46_25240 [Serratia marcescens]|nr:hypothetical protein RN42_25380 [Serratia marcescens]OHT35984.1 hypothetical protein BGV45_25235 [Serratia marcescens]OHT38042.1 hypothetical protein BGV46_25240 [Serratia marcescens]
MAVPNLLYNMIMLTIIIICLLLKSKGLLDRIDIQSAVKAIFQGMAVREKPKRHGGAMLMKAFLDTAPHRCILYKG